MGEKICEDRTWRVTRKHIFYGSKYKTSRSAFAKGLLARSETQETAHFLPSWTCLYIFWFNALHFGMWRIIIACAQAILECSRMTPLQKPLVSAFDWFKSKAAALIREQSVLIFKLANHKWLLMNFSGLECLHFLVYNKQKLMLCQWWYYPLLNFSCNTLINTVHNTSLILCYAFL